MMTNTQLFREASLHFKKHGFYCGEIPGSPQYFEYWDEQIRRCEEGYKVGGVHITGHHYFYLNFFQILRVPEGTDASHKGKVNKIEDFPAFWDLDYDWFKAIERAESEGKHMICLKTRGRGFSYKAASMGLRNYNLHRKSKNFYLANETEYLTKDGVLSKVWDAMSFIDQHTPWGKRRQKKDDLMYKRASYMVQVEGKWIEKGYLSEIVGVTMGSKPDKARGKRGELVIFEEAGSFPHLKKAWQLARPSVEAGKYNTGMLIAFGTGGDQGPGMEGLDDMFYAPDAYNALAFDNRWDESKRGKCCYFIPEYTGMDGFIDKDGNSDIEGSKAFSTKERDTIKEAAKDPYELDRYVAEHPFTPQEALMRAKTNFFPTLEILSWKNKLEATGVYKHIGVPGNLYRSDTGIIFQPGNATPMYAFPVRKAKDRTGCPVIYQAPYKDENGKVPYGLYAVVHDPYAFDNATTDSIGAAYVIKRMNNFSKPDNMIVASLNGRPETQDEYNNNLFMLAEYYNAKIGFENDRGDVIGYAKRFRKLHYLEEEFEILDKTEVVIRRLGRKYGMSMSDEKRKLQGAGYFKDWLRTPRGVGEDGDPRMNLHLIYDIGLLEEILQWDMDGNFDRVSAMIVGMYYLKTLAINPKETQAVDENSFFQRELFV